MVKLYNYDSANRLMSIKDSIGRDSIIYKYRVDGRLSSSIKNLGNFVYSSEYFYNPYRVNTIRMKDSTVVYNKTKEYERNFYVKRFFGNYLKPKLKKVESIIDGETNTTAYSDYEDLQWFKDDKTIMNSFDSDGRSTKSEIRSVFMNDRINEYGLYYKYYKNGLLKSIRGYVPRYFEYEFWE